MNIRLLRIFQTVAKTESISKAAKELFLSQPAVSKAILQLEESLGVKLFDRLSRRIYLNENGRKFLRQTNDLLNQYEKLESTFKQTTEKLNIGSSITISKYLLPSVINHFNEEFDIFVKVDNAKSIESSLLKNEVDLGLIEGVINHPELRVKPLRDYECIVFCSQKHPFSQLKEITLDQFLNEKILCREKGSSIRDILDSTLLLKNKKIDPYWESINSEVLIEAVNENLGLCLLPRVLIQSQLEKKEFIELKVEDLIFSNPAQIVYHKDKEFSLSIKKFIDYLDATTG